MRQSQDKKALRLKVVLYAKDHGVKSAARTFHATRNTVRKWLRRWQHHAYEGLADLSRRPHHCPNATPLQERRKLVQFKKKYKRLGADQIKHIESLSRSARTIRKIWRQEGVSSRKRRKKYLTKRNLRAIKKEFALFQQVVEDTKDLFDIPEYWPQMKRLHLPEVQYTRRDVTSGLLFLGFANERSLTYSTLFCEYVDQYLLKLNAILSNSIRQTDNGSEYIGSWHAKHDSSFTKAVQKIPGQFHFTIFPGAHRMQADVETVHGLMETEFYEIESFTGRTDFMNKAYSYNLSFNLIRPNSYKENQTPWQIVKQKDPSLPIQIAMIPPVDLDQLFCAKMSAMSYQGGHDVYSNPY
jgi:transposase-like protein